MEAKSHIECRRRSRIDGDWSHETAARLSLSLERELQTFSMHFSILLQRPNLFVFQGVVTAATSLISRLAQKSPDDFKTSVSLAVARLSRVGVTPKRV